MIHSLNLKYFKNYVVLFQCDCNVSRLKDGDMTLHFLTHVSPYNIPLLRKMITARVNDNTDFIGPLSTKLIG